MRNVNFLIEANNYFTRKAEELDYFYRKSLGFGQVLTKEHWSELSTHVNNILVSAFRNYPRAINNPNLRKAFKSIYEQFSGFYTIYLCDLTDPSTWLWADPAIDNPFKLAHEVNSLSLSPPQTHGRKKAAWHILPLFSC